MIKKPIIILVLLLSSCSSPYFVYHGDIYLSGKELYKDVQVLDKGIPNEIFFYDKKLNGHLLIGDISIKSKGDTIYVKR